MNPRESLAAYLNKIESRFRWGTTARGLAIAALAALSATLALVVLLNSVEFERNFVIAARVVLFLSIAIALCFGLGAPLLALNRRRAAHRVEAKFPEFGERLVTFAEKENQAIPDPFLPLLAADALKVAARVEPAQVLSSTWIAGFASAALALVGTLTWLIFAGPGYLGAGANLLWAGPPRIDTPGIGLTKSITIKPGNRKVRRKTDQMVSAELIGFHAPIVKMYARYHSGSKWEQAPMLPQGQSNGYEFLFSGLPESVDYYVEAAGAKSATFTLTAVDLPGVKRMKVTYQYPAWLGLKAVSEEPAGDLRAVTGTEAILSIETDKPLTTGVLMLDDGKKIEVKAKEGNWLEARVPIQKDGLYYIAAMDDGQPVRLTDDYFIEARKDTEPTLRVRKPGRDLKVSPIEEVPFEIEATDDYGLQDVTLHYSVNGGEEKSVVLGKGGKEIHAKTMLSLEDFSMVPGDVVSFYATARDAKTTAQTDMYFLEAQPYEKEYSQSQQGGGGGGGGEGGQDSKVSERQKEIISATWNQIRNRFSTPAQQQENAKFLSEQEAKLSEQAKSLAKRMRSRELTGGNQEFEQFAKNMDEAVKAMGGAVDKLKVAKLQPSLADQQKALQHLMRAEAIFKQIQVAFGSKGGGGGGGGGAGRELESLFDLELDTEKNQFETGQQASSEQKAKEVDEALEKLKQLARKQEELADARQKSPQSFEQRWQQDMLRRQAEELKKQMEQLSRGSESSQSQSQSQSQSSSSSSSQGQQGQQSGSPQSQQQQQQQAGNRNQQQQQQQQPKPNSPTRERLRDMAGANEVDPRLKQALERLDAATKDMQRAGDSKQGGETAQSAADARRAAERLNEAKNLLGGMRGQQTSDKVHELSQRASDLADKQRDFSERMKQTFPNTPSGQPTPSADRAQSAALGQEKEKLQEKLQGLERSMQDALRELNNGKGEAAGKVREGLELIQKDQLGLRMKYNAENIKNGFGAYVRSREDMVTADLDKLREMMQQAEKSMNGQSRGGSDKEKGLAGVEKLREQMESMAQAARGQQQGKGQGQQPGQNGQQAGNQPGQQGQGQGQQGKPGQNGQQAGNQPGQQGQGQQPGQGEGQGQGQQGQGQQGQGQGQGGQQGQGGGQRAGGGNQQGGGTGAFGNPGRDNFGGNGYGAMNRGDVPFNTSAMEGALRDGARNLNELRQALGQGKDVESAEMSKEIERLLQEIRDIDPKQFKGNPELIEKIRTQLLPSLEHLELSLRRQVDDSVKGQVRTPASDKVPAGYAQAVADYFRKLSSGK